MRRLRISPARPSPASAPDRAIQERAAAFLARAIPDELKPEYVTGSLVEVVFRVVASGAWPDGEQLELLELGADDCDARIAAARTPELRDYFEECRALAATIVSARQP